MPFIGTDMLTQKLDFRLTCAFTGHRNIAEKDRKMLEEKLDILLPELAEKGVERFICGCALGFDTLAAQAVLRLKEKHNVFFELALPCKDQTLKWNEKQKAEYNRIKERADRVNVLFDKYVTGCMQFRDAFMVDNSDILISYYRGRPGGTQYTYLYAENRGLKIIRL